MSFVSAPLQRVSAVDELAQALRTQILDGNVRSGDQLREAEIAEAYRVARNTVRSALQSLVHDGLAQHEPHRGVFVRQFAAADVHDIFVLRGALESEAAYLVCKEHLPINRLLEAVTFLESIDDAPWSELMDADVAVHRALVSCIESPRFDQAFSSIVAQMRLVAAQPLDRPRHRVVARQHRVIASAVASRNAEAAIHEVRAHLALARGRMLRGLEEKTAEGRWDI